MVLQPDSSQFLQARQDLWNGNYSKAISQYQLLVDLEPQHKSHVWNLGLALLLYGEEAEAQATWMMGMMEGSEEEISQWSADLAQILTDQANRVSRNGDFEIALALRQYIQELHPGDLSNLLHLLQLATQTGTLSLEIIDDYSIVDLLQSGTTVDRAVILETLKVLFEAYPLEIHFLKLAEASALYFDDATPLVQLLMNYAVEVGNSMKQPGIGIQYCLTCLKIWPDNLGILYHLSSLQQNAHLFQDGIASARQFSDIAANPAEKLQGSHLLTRALMRVGDWVEINQICEQQAEWIQQVEHMSSTETPRTAAMRVVNATFFRPYIHDRLAQNRQIQNQLMAFCQQQFEREYAEIIQSYKIAINRRLATRPATKKLRIGYLSHCFRQHSVGWLCRWLIQHHDRDRFELYGYFWDHQPRLQDDLQDFFIQQMDVARLLGRDATEIANQVFQDEIDILVELDSLTADIAIEIMALKPAPIQVTWLGWDASGLPAIDYFIADSYVLPEDADAHYREKIVRLPNSYIAVDGFEVGIPTVQRSDLNIPQDAIIYLSCQNNAKRRPDMVHAQMKILQAIPNSYLLIKDTAGRLGMQSFVKDIAQAEGVDPSRLRFLENAPTEAEHRANLRIADVVLDTYPYNGATTTMETLWMGIPIVTRVGETFSSRNSYTMMINAGITEGIAWSEAEYIEWGIRLGQDETLRQKVTWKLHQSRQTSPLWDATALARQMEEVFTQMWRTYQEKANVIDGSLDDLLSTVDLSIKAVNPLRILVISNLYPPQVMGGYERSIADFARRLQHRGHEVLVVTADAPNYQGHHQGQFPDPIVERSLKLCGEWVSGTTPTWFDHHQIMALDTQNRQVLRQQVLDFQPDICLMGNIDFLLVSPVEELLAAKVPTLHYVMNKTPGYAAQQTPENLLYRYVTCSHWVMDYLQKSSYPTATTQTIYPGAAVEEFYQAQLPPCDRLKIAYASLVGGYKGTDVLIDALYQLHQQDIDFTATIAGGTFQPQYLEALKEFVRDHNLSKQVAFVGTLSRQELISLYATHNVLVFPSRFEEPFGISQIEAMAAGLILVTSGTGGAREIVQPGYDGFIFESENSAALAEVLSSLASRQKEQPEQWEAIARRGQQKAIEMFSQTKAVELLESAFYDLLQLKHELDNGVVG